MAPQLADGLTQGRVAFLPMQMRAVFDYVASQPFDVVMLQTAFDRDGNLRLGPNVDFAAAAMSSARMLIGEVNEAIVAPAGCPRVDESRFEALVRTQRPLAPFGGGVPDGTAHRIAEHVAGLVRDGDCIQTGIGAIPAAILAALANKNDLGMHSGLIGDGGMDLIVPARLPAETLERVAELAVASFVATDCEGMARVDFFVRPGGEVVVNELNTIPGFTATSVYAKLFAESGIPYAELLDRLVALALERHEQRKSLEY